MARRSRRARREAISFWSEQSATKMDLIVMSAKAFHLLYRGGTVLIMTTIASTPLPWYLGVVCGRCYMDIFSFKYFSLPFRPGSVL